MSQQIIDAAKAPVLGYNAKDWNAVRAAVAPGFVYDEVATQRRAEGADAVLNLWKGWATALPDSSATFHNALASGNTAVLEVTWKGTHTGPLQMPAGPLAPTGKPIEIRASMVVEVADGKAKTMRQYFDMATLLQQLGAM